MQEKCPRCERVFTLPDEEYRRERYRQWYGRDPLRGRAVGLPVGVRPAQLRDPEK